MIGSMLFRKQTCQQKLLHTSAFYRFCNRKSLGCRRHQNVQPVIASTTRFVAALSKSDFLLTPLLVRARKIVVSSSSYVSTITIASNDNEKEVQSSETTKNSKMQHCKPYDIVEIDHLNSNADKGDGDWFPLNDVSNMHPLLVRALHCQKIYSLTKIQYETWNCYYNIENETNILNDEMEYHLDDRNDILGISPKRSGKTLAFLLPVINDELFRIDTTILQQEMDATNNSKNNCNKTISNSNKAVHTLILVPNHEFGQKIHDVASSLLANISLSMLFDVFRNDETTTIDQQELQERNNHLPVEYRYHHQLRAQMIYGRIEKQFNFDTFFSSRRTSTKKTVTSATTAADSTTTTNNNYNDQNSTETTTTTEHKQHQHQRIHIPNILIGVPSRLLYYLPMKRSKLVSYLSSIESFIVASDDELDCDLREERFQNAIIKIRSIFKQYNDKNKYNAIHHQKEKKEEIENLLQQEMLQQKIQNQQQRHRCRTILFSASVISRSNTDQTRMTRSSLTPFQKSLYFPFLTLFDKLRDDNDDKIDRSSVQIVHLRDDATPSPPTTNSFITTSTTNLEVSSSSTTTNVDNIKQKGTHYQHTYVVLPYEYMISGTIQIIQSILTPSNCNETDDASLIHHQNEESNLSTKTKKIVVFFPTADHVLYFSTIFRDILGIRVLSIHCRQGYNEQIMIREQFFRHGQQVPLMHVDEQPNDDNPYQRTFLTPKKKVDITATTSLNTAIHEQEQEPIALFTSSDDSIRRVLVVDLDDCNVTNIIQIGMQSEDRETYLFNNNTGRQRARRNVLQVFFSNAERDAFLRFVGSMTDGSTNRRIITKDSNQKILFQNSILQDLVLQQPFSVELQDVLLRLQHATRKGSKLLELRYDNDGHDDDDDELNRTLYETSLSVYHSLLSSHQGNKIKTSRNNRFRNQRSNIPDDQRNINIDNDNTSLDECIKIANAFAIQAGFQELPKLTKKEAIRYGIPLNHPEIDFVTEQKQWNSALSTFDVIGENRSNKS